MPRGELPELEPGQVIAIVNVDLSKMEIEPARRKAVRLNVSIPDYVVSLIDQAAARVSGFITKATLDYIDRRVAR